MPQLVCSAIDYWFSDFQTFRLPEMNQFVDIA